MGAFGRDDELLGEALGELDRRDLATALGAMADGAVAERTARRALGELTAEMDVEALLNGRSAIPGRPGAERELRGQYARAAVEAFARRDAPESFAEAAERVEELLATRHGRRPSRGGPDDEPGRGAAPCCVSSPATRGSTPRPPSRGSPTTPSAAARCTSGT